MMSSFFPTNVSPKMLALALAVMQCVNEVASIHSNTSLNTTSASTDPFHVSKAEMIAIPIGIFIACCLGCLASTCCKKNTITSSSSTPLVSSQQLRYNSSSSSSV